MLRFFIILFFTAFPSLSGYAALSPDQLFARIRDVYYVNKDVNLNGDTLVFHSGSKLRFKGGVIANGGIIFDSTRIENRPKFRNCSYNGDIIIKKIDDRNFTSSDDLGTLRFLLKNTINLGIRCEINRDYTINMKDVPGSVGILSFRNIDSGADIHFNHHTISNTHPFLPNQIKPVLRFFNVKNVTIHDCKFHDTDENNTHYFEESTGCSFIQCIGDCESINLLNCSQENGDCILRSAGYGLEEQPTRGIFNSVIKVKSFNSGYGLVLSCGDSLTIDIETNSPHRGFYCTGVSNSTINYSGYNPVETKTHILVKDAVYRYVDESGNASLDMKGCSNLTINAYVPVLNSGEQILCLQSYGSGLKEGADFRFRKQKCHHQNIDFTARVKVYPKEGYYIISRVASDSGALDEDDMIGCKVTGFRIHDIHHLGGQARRYMCTIDTHADVDMCVENCSADKDGAFRFQIIGSASGRMILNNSQCGDILVRKKTSGDFYIERKGKKHFDGQLSYINDESKRNLVKIIQ